MKVSYFPGCTLKNKAKDLDMYAYRSAAALGVTLEEIENWQCCGGVFTSAANEVATKLSSVRALKYASDRSQPLVTVCSACHNVIKQTNHAMQNNKEFADKVNRYMAEDTAYAGEADILLVPNYEVGNAIGKAMTVFAHARNAGIVLGAKVPIVLVSRSDSVESKLTSIALGCILAP